MYFLKQQEPVGVAFHQQSIVPATNMSQVMFHVPAKYCAVT